MANETASPVAWERLARWAMAKAAWILVALLAVTVAFGYFLKDIRMDSSVDTLMPQGEPVTDGASRWGR